MTTTTTTIWKGPIPEYGCEHMQSLHTSKSASFQSVISRFKILQGKLQDGISITSAAAPVLIRGLWLCLHCSENSASVAERKAHAKDKGHTFAMNSRSGEVMCHSCSDVIYDQHLEVLRAPSKASIALRKRTAEELDGDVGRESTKVPCGKEGARGLYNLGQTCYMNCVLQTMLHSPLLTSYFLSNSHPTYDCTINGCVLCAVSEAFAEFHSRDKTDAFGVTNLLLASWQSNSQLAGYQQQDAHEFYQFLVDSLHSGAVVNAAPSGTPIDTHNPNCDCFFHKAFFGKLRSTVTCDKCGNVTKTSDPMVDLSLDVQVQAKKKQLGGKDVSHESSQTPTLEECLGSFTAPEKLVADAYNCAGCGNTPQKATKQMRIKKLPAIMCLQLKRFEHTLTSTSPEKLQGRVDFPLTLNMYPYTTLSRPNSSTTTSNPSSSPAPSPQTFTYDLESAIVHKGKLDSGHYYAYCRQPPSSSAASTMTAGAAGQPLTAPAGGLEGPNGGDQWLMFNDDQVTSVGEAEVLGADAYLLFYGLRRFSTSGSVVKKGTGNGNGVKKEEE